MSFSAVANTVVSLGKLHSLRSSLGVLDTLIFHGFFISSQDINIRQNDYKCSGVK